VPLQREGPVRVETSLVPVFSGCLTDLRSPPAWRHPLRRPLVILLTLVALASSTLAGSAAGASPAALPAVGRGYWMLGAGGQVYPSAT
jgi:hypothetical protein